MKNKKSEIVIETLIVFVIISFLGGYFIGLGNKDKNQINTPENYFSFPVKEKTDSLAFSNDSVKKDTIVIQEGGSLISSLKMSKYEAEMFAQKFSFKERYIRGKYIVIVHPGDTFIKTWMPIRYPKK